MVQYDPYGTYWTTASSSTATYNVTYTYNPIKYRHIPINGVIVKPRPFGISEVVEYDEIQPPKSTPQLKKWLEKLYGKIPDGIRIAIGLVKSDGFISFNEQNTEHVEWVSQIDNIFSVTSLPWQNGIMVIGEMKCKKEISVEI